MAKSRGECIRVTPKPAVDGEPMTQSHDDDCALQLMRRVLRDKFHGGDHLLYLRDETFWIYNGRHWEQAGRASIEKRVLRTLLRHSAASEQRTTLLIKDVVELLKMDRAHNGDPLRFNSPPIPVINCQNCELWFHADGTVESRKHNPRSYLRHCLAVDYDPTRKCPQYNAAIEGIFANARNPTAMGRLWHEVLGYILQPTRGHALIVVLYGAGNNGKTRLLQTLIRLLGQAQVHSGSVEELESNRFIIGNLVGRLLFVDDDVARDAHLSDGALKKLSETKTLTGERKFKDHTTFVSTAVPILLCNNIPMLSDLSYGMLRRLKVLPFDRKFTTQTNDVTLFDRIWATELPGILNRAVRGWQRLQKRGHFAWPKDVQRTTRSWLKFANPQEGFAADECEEGPRYACLLDDFYRAYRTWAKSSGIRTIDTKQTVLRNLRHRGFVTKKSDKGRKVLGLRLKGAAA